MEEDHRMKFLQPNYEGYFGDLGPIPASRLRYAGGKCARTVISIKLDGGAGGLAVSEWSKVKRMLE